MSDATHTKVLIIGAGPAGLTAAIYAARAELKPLVMEGLVPGGQLMITTDVENFPGFPDGIMGPEIIEKFRGQAERFGTQFRYGMVTKVDTTVRPFRCEIDEDPEDVVLADTIIIASGADAKWLGLEDEKRLMNAGVSACATCDGAFFKGVEIGVVGGGDTAMEEACSSPATARTSMSWFVAMSSARPKSWAPGPWLREDHVHWNSEVCAIDGTMETGVTGVTTRNRITGDDKPP